MVALPRALTARTARLERRQARTAEREQKRKAAELKRAIDAFLEDR